MWEWVREVLVDEMVPDDGSGLIDGHNQMVGSIRFRQQRARETACRDVAPPGVALPTAWFGGAAAVERALDGAASSQMIIDDDTGVCYSPTAFDEAPIELGDADGTVSPFERNGIGGTGVRNWFAYGSYRGYWRFDAAGHVVDVSPYNRSKADALVDAMADGAWVDDSTRVLWIDWTMYNRQLSAVLVTHLTIELPTTGGALPDQEVVLFALPRRSVTPLLVCELALLVLNVVGLWRELDELCSGARAYFHDACASRGRHRPLITTPSSSREGYKAYPRLRIWLISDASRWRVSHFLVFCNLVLISSFLLGRRQGTWATYSRCCSRSAGSPSG